MVVGDIQQGTLDPGFVILGTRQRGVPVILRELMPPRRTRSRVMQSETLPLSYPGHYQPPAGLRCNHNCLITGW
ncbi:unnamed protein product [Schistosoma mattheei]|uniref:Uncharacterized protein n=1 Tax=Schistosoma mattheei TaxID=31246 RepID=A0A183PZS4_9TREM|nr:unnamed protein product [Schistosoma mattheei]